MMKTIKIFLASSEELKSERVEMTELVYQLNRLYKVRGIELDLERWEYLDASMGSQRKQDDYNDVLKQCDICVVLFWRRLGCFTGEELDIAYQQMRNGGKPQKIYVFLKNPGDDATSELKEFIQNYGQRFGGHFYGKFQNVDALKLEFLLQFELYQKDYLGKKTIEVRKDHICVDNESIMDFNQLPFAANNREFQKKKEELKDLCEEVAALQVEIEKKKQKLLRKRQKFMENPDDEDCREDYEDAKEAVDNLTNDLQNKLNKKNKLEKDYEYEQQNLLNTARRIVEAREKMISDRMLRAIEAFEGGDANRADILLDEAEKDADEALNDVRVAKKLGIRALEELTLKCSVKMANSTIPIEIRIEETQKIYEKALSLARECDYDEIRYLELIEKYGDFLVEYGKYEDAGQYRWEFFEKSQHLFGEDNKKTAEAANKLGRLQKRKDLLLQSLTIWEKTDGEENLFLADIYSNLSCLGSVTAYENEALLYNQKALAIRKKILGENHPITANSYNDIGMVLLNGFGNFKDALSYYKKALGIFERELGEEHRYTANTYYCFAEAYYLKRDYSMALEYYQKAMHIYEKVLGKEHPDTTKVYLKIAEMNNSLLHDYLEALKYLYKALDVFEKVLGKKHRDTALTYVRIAEIYEKLRDFPKAIEYYEKVDDEKDEMLTLKRITNTRIAQIYKELRDYPKALEHYMQTLYIDEKNWIEVLNKDYPGTNIQGRQEIIDLYEDALPWAEEAVAAEPNNSYCIETLAVIKRHLGNKI